MPTNKIVLRTAEEFMQDYTPIYKPIFPNFLGGKSQQYPAETGNLSFRRLNAVGDLRGKHITPKDTEMKQISVMEGKKTFNKYFLASQYVQSQLQDQAGIEEVVKQVLDENQKQMDELFLLGEGTSNATVVNNSLFWSGDPNHTTETSVEIASSGRLVDLHTKVVGTASKADQLAGRKICIFYGNVIPYFRSLHDSAGRAFRAVLQEALPDYEFIEMPTAITPASSNGWIIANLDQVKLHYTLLPRLLDQGVNPEKMYSWHNMAIGSTMLEVLAQNAVIRQPSTLAA